LDNVNKVQHYREQVDRQKTEKELLEQQLQQQVLEIRRRKKHTENLIKARWVVSEVARLTQSKFTDYVESLVTMAIRSVFDRPYQFLVDFQIKRNKSECYLSVQEGDWEPYVPKDEQGGGIVDVISFALRVVLWSLQKPRSRNLIVLDEPLKNMGSLMAYGGEMLREISHRLGFQLLVVTHERQLADMGDRVWEVKHNGVFSEVSLMGEEIKKKRKRIEL